MGYLEVLELSKQILLLGQLDSVRTVNSQWEEAYNSSTDLIKPYYKLISSVPVYPSYKTTSSRQKPQANPKRNVVCKICSCAANFT